MINIRSVKNFCNEDISLIENYDKALNDTKTWDCHHRRETDEGLSVKQLKEQGLYLNRPASELIFLTHEEHTSLHKSGKLQSKEQKEKHSESIKGENHPMYGKHHKKESKQKMSDSHKGIPQSEESKRKKSEANKGNPCPTKGKHRVYDNKELKIYHYE